MLFWGKSQEPQIRSLFRLEQIYRAREKIRSSLKEASNTPQVIKTVEKDEDFPITINLALCDGVASKRCDAVCRV